MLAMGDRQGRRRRARARGRQARRSRGGAVPARLAYANPEVGKKDDARKAWKKATHVKEAALALGVDAYEGGDLDEAVKRLKGAAALDASYQAAYYQLGLVYKEQGETAAARDAWQKAMRIDPKSDLGKWASTKLQVLTGNVNAFAEGQVIDSASEIGIGQEITKQVVDRWGLMKDPALEDRLNKVLHRLAAVADRPERELRYKVVLVDVPMINALTLPGGTMLVFRGLVDMVKSKMGDTDDALRVGARPRVRARGAAPRHGHDPGGVVDGRRRQSGQLPRWAAASDLYALLMTISRAHEFEADQFGALYAYRAGFNPADVGDVAREDAAGDGRDPARHDPSDARRAHRARARLPARSARQSARLRSGGQGAQRRRLRRGAGEARGLPRRVPRFAGGALEPRRRAASQGALGARAVDALSPLDRRRSQLARAQDRAARRRGQRRRAQAGAEDRRAHDQRGDGRISGGARASIPITSSRR